MNQKTKFQCQIKKKVRIKLLNSPSMMAVITTDTGLSYVYVGKEVDIYFHKVACYFIIDIPGYKTIYVRDISYLIHVMCLKC